MEFRVPFDKQRPKIRIQRGPISIVVNLEALHNELPICVNDNTIRYPFCIWAAPPEKKLLSPASTGLLGFPRVEC